jgi:hypothetical protein
MSVPASGSAFERFISPPVLFVGMAGAFAVCCLGGRLASRQNLFQHFQRFHNYINPMTQFYPTASQVRELARSRLEEGKILVIIGGNSVLYGWGQAPPDLWSSNLQALLGDRYQVINLGLGGMRPGEFGATAAEMLFREHPKLIFITNNSPGNFITDPDGAEFKYFFWDAYYKGLLLPNLTRAEQLRELEKQAGTAADRRRELQREMALDSLLYFNDLWTTVAYKNFSTLWTPLTRNSFTRARHRYADNDYVLQLGGGRNLHDRAAYIHNLVQLFAEHPKETWAKFDHSAMTCFTEPIRKRTLIVVWWQSPDYLALASVEDRAGYALLSRQTAQHLEKSSFRALEVGQDFLTSDYGDSIHLMPWGGAKLAAALAPEVRKLARQLGYLREAP